MAVLLPAATSSRPARFKRRAHVGQPKAANPFGLFFFKEFARNQAAFRDLFAVKSRLTDRAGLFHASTGMKVATMKLMHAGESRISRTTTTSGVPGFHPVFDGQKERTTNALAVIGGVAAIVALYAVMFAAVYLWNRHALIFPSNGAYGLAMVEATSWSQSTG